jgi:hypothetical protein
VGPAISVRATRHDLYKCGCEQGWLLLTCGVVGPCPLPEVDFLRDELELLVVASVRLENLWALFREAEECSLARLKSQCQDLMARHHLQVSAMALAPLTRLDSAVRASDASRDDSSFHGCA